MYKTVKPTTFTLPLALLDDLNALSKESGRKKTSIVTDALEMYMDYHDLNIAEQRLADKKDQRVKADEFFKDLGL